MGFRVIRRSELVKVDAGKTTRVGAIVRAMKFVGEQAAQFRTRWLGEFVSGETVGCESFVLPILRICFFFSVVQ